MINRCRQKTKYTKYWGGKGITVCDEWQGRNGFENFYKWSIANGYSEDLTIDRIDSNGNYEPNNCRWVDSITQNNNLSNNHCVIYKGEIKTIAQLSREYRINYQTLYSRILKGWDLERALTKGVN
jgi:hypothetical protein